MGFAAKRVGCCGLLLYSGTLCAQAPQPIGTPPGTAEPQAPSAASNDGQVPVNSTQQVGVEPAAADTGGVGDIIVTAQRRSESARNVPIAITAIGSEALRQSSINNILDVARLAPSLKIDLGVRANTTRLSIRGIGSSGGTAVEPSVATFVDGAYLPREGMLQTAIYDLEAIEVLRGPQGTLFGRNASVGAISLRSATPSAESGGHLSAEYGTGDRKKVEGFINAPVSDDVRLRFAGTGEIFQGFYHNRLTDKRVGGADTFAGRATAEIRPTSTIKDTLRLSYAYRKGNDPMQPYETVPRSFPAGTLAGFVARYTAIGSTVDLTPFDFKVNEFIDDRISDKQFGAINSLTWEVGGGFQVGLISSYRNWNFDQRGTDLLAAQTPTLFQTNQMDSKSHSEELQIFSPNDFLSDHLSFVGGLYYFHEKLRVGEQLEFARDFCNLLFPGNALYASCIGGVGSRVGDNQFNQRTNSLAGYGQATLKVIPKVDITLGIRYTRDRKRANTTQVRNTAAGGIYFANENVDLRISNGRPTYRANVAWRPSSNAMIFATYSTGFKSGGFNSTSSAVALNQQRILKPETVQSYEAGIKSNFLDRRLEFNILAFQMDLKNFQDRSFNGTVFSVVNAGNIRNRGVEVDAFVRPIPHVRLNGSLAYLDAKFTSYPNGSNLPGLPGVQDLSGTRPTFSPKWSGAAGADVDGAFGSSGLTWLLHSDLSFTAKQNINGTNNNDPLAVQKGYALLGARFTVYGRDKRWSAAIFGQNLTDHHYCTGYASQVFGGLLGVVRNGQSLLRCNPPAPPRTIGGALTLDF